MSERGYKMEDFSFEDGHSPPGLQYEPVPVASPSSGLMQATPTLSNVASETDKSGRITTIDPPTRPWTPIPLRRWFAISLICFMLLVAAGLEIALHFSNKQQGWRVSSSFAATSGILHYVYTLPPVAVAMIIVAMWAWTDVDIKRMQPYIDLAYGNAPAAKSLLLDYSNTHPAIVSISAYHHSHYIVAISSVMVLVGLAIQPLAASLFTVKDTWSNAPNVNVTSFKAPGLDPTFSNLTAFSTAAGFIQANVLYNATPPNFVKTIWAIAPLEVPSDQVANGTMFANTTSVRSTGNCKPADTGSLTPFTNGTGFTISGTSNNCNVSIPVTTNGSVAYGVDIVTCPGSPPPDQFKPVIFWVINSAANDANPPHSLVFCSPTIELLNAAVQVALQTGDLQNATSMGNFSQPNNITDPNGIMQGRAMNGVAFNITAGDVGAQNRMEASKTGLTAAMVQKAQLSPGGLSNQIQTFGMTGITENLYELYLSLIARTIYFVPNQGANLEVAIKTFQPRLWFVDETAHILTGVLIAFAIVGTFIHILHHRTRDLVILPNRPGTLASAAALTARSNIGDILDGHLDQQALDRILKHKRFRIDRNTGRIVMEGDDGYETGAVLPPHRSMVTRLRELGAS